ncbi:uncharacterized protein LOC143462275 [Clavelina lepadiformis]|uniref:uncharacterized protein LOC143462275 n=1 Tax=Clavelina lepadiformis TaxID=159417 RepID=UPI0040419CC4
MAALPGIQLLLNQNMVDLQRLSRILTLVRDSVQRKTEVELRQVIVEIHREAETMCRDKRLMLQNISTNIRNICPLPQRCHHMVAFPSSRNNAAKEQCVKSLSEKFMSMADRQVKLGNTQVTYERTTASQVEKVTISSSSYQSSQENDEVFPPTSHQMVEYSNGYMTSCGSGLEMRECGTPPSDASSQYPSSSSLSAAPNYPSVSDNGRRLKEVSVRKSRSSEINHQQSRAHERRNRSLTPQGTPCKSGTSPGSGHFTFAQYGSDQPTSSVPCQCLRDCFDEFICRTLPSTNDWYRFTRIGLQLSDEELHHIDDNYKSDAYARKFEKLKAWGKGKLFTSKEDIIRKLEEALIRTRFPQDRC